MEHWLLLLLNQGFVGWGEERSGRCVDGIATVSSPLLNKKSGHLKILS